MQEQIRSNGHLVRLFASGLVGPKVSPPWFSCTFFQRYHGHLSRVRAYCWSISSRALLIKHTCSILWRVFARPLYTLSLGRIPRTTICSVILCADSTVWYWIYVSRTISSHKVLCSRWWRSCVSPAARGNDVEYCWIYGSTFALRRWFRSGRFHSWITVFWTLLNPTSYSCSVWRSGDHRGHHFEMKRTPTNTS